MITEDDLKTSNESLAELFEAAARKTAEPLVFDDADTTAIDTEN